ncbi:MAG: hypothetical protein ACOY5C_08495 [Pseudomonadota bacterium]|uniref:hypothetical protein n=1 Tax=Thermithiobacillus tepidarius TaxID=929 RepID=UPI0003FEEB75|nr:hypothetical protein [Thermithiobacillus tepidarius]
MSQKLIKMVKLNNLQYNANRDPQVYRRVAGHPFRVQLMLDGSGQANVELEAEGKVLCSKTVALPGTFSCEVSFNTPGVRIANITVNAGGRSETVDLRLDVEAHVWVG